MIYKGARAVIQSGAQLGTSQKFADASARKAQDVRKTRESAATAKERVDAVEQTLQESGLRGDDGVPPGYPTVTAEAFFHQADLYWPRPPASDEVVGSLVRIRPENEASRIVSRGVLSATIKNLPHKPHTFEVLLFDKWGRESLWSDPVTATPMLTAAETIDLSEIAVLGRLRGLLPDTNLATITDATKLADELVSSGKIAPGAVTGPKLPDGVINGPKLAASAVEADKIAANAVTAPKILSDSVQTRHITAGAVTASVMAAQDAAAFNLWAQNAMIRSAAVQSITADKIAAGAMTAGAITIAGGGSIKAGGVVMDSSGFSSGGVIMDSNGMTLPAVQGRSSLGLERHLKIATPIAQSGMYFVWDNSSYYAILQSESNQANGKQGLAELAGINNSSDFDAGGNATIIASSYNPGNTQSAFTALRAPQNTVVGAFLVDGKFFPKVTGGQSSIAANGGSSAWTHNYGNIPNHVEAWCNMGGGVHRPIDYIQQLFIEDVTTSLIRVRNHTGTNRNVYIYAWE